MISQKLKRGTIVYYRTDRLHEFGAVVVGKPWNIATKFNPDELLVELRGLGQEFKTATGSTMSSISGVSCDARHLRLAPTIFANGAWTLDSEAEPQALVTYTFEPCSETGHIGWCWWALGHMGDASSYEQARAKAEAVVARRAHKGDEP